MSDIKVIGIDPAPSKKSTIYDGEKFEHKDYASLKKYLPEELEKNKKILICWDAPLPHEPSVQCKLAEATPSYYFAIAKHYLAPIALMATLQTNQTFTWFPRVRTGAVVVAIGEALLTIAQRRLCRPLNAKILAIGA